MRDWSVAGVVSVVSAIVGLIVDTVAIAGLAIGLIDPAQFEFPGATGALVATATLLILFYCLAVICCALFIGYEKRVRAAGIKNRSMTRETATGVVIAYALWTPPFVLWLIYVYGPWSGFWAGIWLAVFLIGGTLVGGFLLLLVAAGVGDWLWPYADVDTGE